ncbi:MAG TPA: phage terminase small subunit P27 family [Spirillospora sp.]|nr:phage terminase small subunit P27 family [Spirillospora sp.]
MADRKTSQQLRLASSNGEELEAQRRHNEERLGGAELDWSSISPGIPEGSPAEEEWDRLSEIYAGQSKRFFESDREILEDWCTWVGIRQEATELLHKEGLMVRGRSKPDKDRSVRNPLVITVAQATKELRALAYHLGFSPEARKRAGVIERTEERSGNEDLLSG